MAVKDTYIQDIRTARMQQLKWTNQIKLMVSGVLSQKDALPLNQSDCPFGKWLYEKAMIFTTVGSREIVDEMITLHTQCYDIYLDIHNILFTAEKGGFIGIFGSKKPSANAVKLAQNEYEKLVAVSDKLIDRIRVFESQMLATPETKFDTLIIVPEPEAAATEDVAEKIAPIEKPKEKIYFRGRLIEG